MAKKYADLGERLIANSVLSTDTFYNDTPCWIWVGKARGPEGNKYPAITLRYKSGPRKGKVYNAGAHRKSVEFFTGRRVTPKMVVAHLCNVRMCINPGHLKGGSQAANVQQCVRDDRHKTPFRDPKKRVAK